MKTRALHSALTGRSCEIGDGPLGRVADRLLANHQVAEADRLGRADARAAMAGKGPALAALQRKLAEAKAADLFDDATPCVSRWDAFQALKVARAQHPADRGIRMAAAHLEQLWHNDPQGALALGDVARVRAHYSSQYGRSMVASVIDTEVPKVSFSSLPIHKLGPIAAQIVGRTDEERQYAYEQVVQANGLTSNKPEHRRARDFLRSAANLAAEPGAPDPTGRGAAERALARMAYHESPILSHMGQVDPAMPGEAAPPPSGVNMEGDEDFSEHGDEAESEGIQEQTIDSPITGEPMVLELEPAPEEPMPGEGDGNEGELEIPPGVVASLAFAGQLDQFDDQGLPGPEDMDDGLDGAAGLAGAGIDAFDTGGQPVELQMEDPTAPGEMLDVTISPAADDTGMGSGMTGAPTTHPGFEGQASRRMPVYAVFAVRGGIRAGQPLERVAALGMPAVLARIARRLADAEGGVIPREVRAMPQTFNQEAFVVLDDAAGCYIHVVAVDSGTEAMSPEMVNGQPLVHHNLTLSKDQGLEALTSKETLHQNVPAAVSTKEAGRLSRAQVADICTRAGLTARTIEDRILGGEEVRVGARTLVLNDAGDVEVANGSRRRVASLAHLDRVIGDFMAFAAVELRGGRSVAASGPRVGFSVRALFSVTCGCGVHGEYLMPDAPENVRCASCGSITPAEAIGIQLEASAETFPGYVVTVDVPGQAKLRKVTAKRMLAAIQQISVTDGAHLRQARLEVTVRNTGDAQMARIRRVLTDTFGVREITAQQAPQAPFALTPSMGQPAGQHPASPMMPAGVSPSMGMPPPQMAQPGQPGQPGGMQQNEQAQMADPSHAPTVKPASRLPVGPGIRHAHIQYDDGRTVWIPVEAASDRAVRDIIGSRFDGTRVLQVRDSMTYQGQAAPPMPGPPPAAPGGAPSAPGAGGPPPGPAGAEMAMPPGPGAAGPAGGAAENVETASVDQRTEEAVRAALLTFRTQGMPVDAAVDNVRSSYKKLLESYGDDTSPTRHLLGAAIMRLAKEVYEQPALVNATAGRRPGRRAGGGGMPTPGKINQQQDAWVSLPGAGKLLGKDSDEGGGYKDPKVNQSVKPLDQSGASGASTDMGKDTSGDEPSFGAKKPPANGHIPAGSGWGQSYTDTALGADTDTGENGETGKWDGVGRRAPRTIRSK